MTTTRTSSTVRAAGAGLPALVQRFKRWRASRHRGQRIPAALWQAATDVARIHGLNPTVAALQLNYYDLQRRLQVVRVPRRGRPSPPVFVEVPPVPLPPGGGERGTVELVAASGARLILRVPDASPAELRRVVELFLRHGP